MGLLDDAIREHLDLKRRHGANAAEVARQEQEALGPVRREAAAAPAAEEEQGDDASYEPTPSERAHQDELYGELVAEVGAGRALVITYINPVVALALGVTILGEQPGAGSIAGLLLILAGSWLSTDGRLPRWLTALSGKPSQQARRSESS